MQLPKYSNFLAITILPLQSVPTSSDVLVSFSWSKFHAETNSYHISSTSPPSPAQSKAVVPLAPFERDKLLSRHLSMTHPRTLHQAVLLRYCHVYFSYIIFNMCFSNYWRHLVEINFFLWLSKASSKTAPEQVPCVQDWCFSTIH